MTAAADLGRLRGELADLLQETDPARPLDSLEAVVVLTYLRNQRLVPATAPAGAQRPNTIEGWLTWVARHSPGS